MPERFWPPWTRLRPAASPAAAAVPSPSSEPRAAGGEGHGVDVAELLDVAVDQLRRAKRLHAMGHGVLAEYRAGRAKVALDLARYHLLRGARS